MGQPFRAAFRAAFGTTFGAAFVQQCAALLLLTAVHSVRAQGLIVDVAGPPDNPLVDGVAVFTIRASNFSEADLPMRLQLQVSRTLDFAPPLFADTTVDGPVATITVPRLLPSSGVLYWRAIALTARVGAIASQITGPLTAPTHLRLISPDRPGGQTLQASGQTFVWHGSRIPPGFGAWDYELRIESTATGLPVAIVRTPDTVVTFTTELETNTSYRWRVTARLAATGDVVMAQSAASFVILSPDQPLATILYQNFPNPFPQPSSTRTCVWFDLHVGGTVSLDIVDPNGLLVRRLVPAVGVPATLPPGRYGRQEQSGCDDRFTWDGTDATGRVVPAGRYLLRLQVSGQRFLKTIVFMGR